MNKSLVITALLIPSLLLGAEWEEHDVKVIQTGPSVTEGATRYVLRDTEGKTFEVNYSSYPKSAGRRRTIALKDVFYGWRHISLTRMEFFFAPDGIYANLQTRRIAWQGENLRPYLPAGLAFHDAPDGLYYRFRIVVEDTSYKLEGKYEDEETLLNEIISFIKTVEEGNLAEADLEKYRIDEYKYSFDEGRGKKEKKAKLKISVFASGIYLKPVGDFARVFSDGYGGMLGVTLHNIGISLNERTLFLLDFSLTAGYWRLNKEESPDSEVTGDVDSSYIIPIILSARYPITLWRGLFIAPLVSVGYNYHHLFYCKTTASREEDYTVTEWAPSLSAGLQIGYPILEDKIILLLSSEFIPMFERERNNFAFLFHAGAGYIF